MYATHLPFLYKLNLATPTAPKKKSPTNIIIASKNFLHV